MSTLNWITEDHLGDVLSCLKVGNFEIVVDHQDYSWFVNRLDYEGDIDWFSFINGNCDSIEEAKEESIEYMEKFMNDFANYASLMKQSKVK